MNEERYVKNSIVRTNEILDYIYNKVYAPVENDFGLMMLEMLMGLMKSWMMNFSLSASRPRRMVNSMSTGRCRWMLIRIR